MPKLTHTFALNAEHVATGQARHWDTEIKGFGLFCGKQSKTWIFQRDIAGKTKRERIGRFPQIPARAAREAAQEMALDHTRGIGKAVMLRQPPTLATALDEYFDRPKKPLRASTEAILRGSVEKHLGDWLSRRIDEIEPGEVEARHRALGKVGPAAANNALRNFQAVWLRAMRRRRSNLLPPTAGMDWFEERGSQPDITNLEHWRGAVAALANPVHRAYYRFLLTTGLRKCEASHLTWEQVRADHIHLPMTKNGKPFDLPLMPEHHGILDAVRGLDPVYVFPAARGGSPLKAPAPLPWTPHAHRRTFSRLAQTKAGLLEETVGRLLNHTPKTLVGTAYTQLTHKDLAKPMKRVVKAMRKLGVFGEEPSGA